MSVTTLENGTYSPTDEKGTVRDFIRSQNDQLEVVDLSSVRSTSGTTMSLYHDELSEYSEAARLSILRGLRQEPTNSLGSFAKYTD